MLLRTCSLLVNQAVSSLSLKGFFFAAKTNHSDTQNQNDESESGQEDDYPQLQRIGGDWERGTNSVDAVAVRVQSLRTQ